MVATFYPLDWRVFGQSPRSVVLGTRNADGIVTEPGEAAMVVTNRENDPPTVVEARQILGNGSVRIVFSEPVYLFTSDILVLDSTSTAVSTEGLAIVQTPGGDTAVIDLAGLALTLGETYTVRLRGDHVQDFAANLLDGAGTGSPGTDYDIMVSIMMPGDADGSGTVDAEDAKIMASNWGKTGTTWADGDFNDDGIVNAIDAAILAANFGATLPTGETTPVEPSAPVEPVIAEATLFVGPLPVGNTPSARQPIQPVQRVGSPMSRSLERLLIETTPESSTAARDTALAEEFGSAIEQPSLLNRHAAWSSMVARRQSNRRDAGDLGRAELAVDLLMAGR